MDGTVRQISVSLLREITRGPLH